MLGNKLKQVSTIKEKQNSLPLYVIKMDVYRKKISKKNKPTKSNTINQSQETYILCVKPKMAKNHETVV